MRTDLANTPGRQLRANRQIYAPLSPGGLMPNLMTDEQRDELKRLCHEADVPDKSGEELSVEAAQDFIDDLRKHISERGRKP